MFKKTLIGTLCLAVVVALGLGGKYLYDTVQYQRMVAEIEIRTPDLSHLADGTYQGELDVGFIAAEVSVVVKDHTIAEITIVKHKNERGGPAEVIIDEVIATQSLEIDTISGATNSSKVILKAIEIALQGA